jgi:hypothetical protein
VNVAAALRRACSLTLHVDYGDFAPSQMLGLFLPAVGVLAAAAEESDGDDAPSANFAGPPQPRERATRSHARRISGGYHGVDGMGGERFFLRDFR